MKPLNKILSITLAIFVLVSSISQSISFHLCAGQVRSMAIFGQAKICDGHVIGCEENERRDAISRIPCCENATVLLSADRYISVKEKVATETPQVISFFTEVAPLEIILFKGFADIQFPNYKPPSIERDIILLVQTFLI